ncbi:NUDIX hydrolase [bacterium]|nr:NUDIX hydrolase [bacterium]
MPKITFTIGVFAVILNKKNQVLLCHRNDRDLWNLPGGCLDNNEAPWEGVIREVKEETGLDVKIDKISGIYSRTYDNDLVLQFICQITGGKITLNPEADQIKYFAFDDIPHNTAQRHLRGIKDYLDEPNKLHTKIQRKKFTRPTKNL